MTEANAAVSPVPALSAHPHEAEALVAARDVTEAQLRMALDIIQKAVPGQQARLSDTSLAALAAGVIQAFATNFAALTISRAAPDAGTMGGSHPQNHSPSSSGVML